MTNHPTGAAVPGSVALPTGIELVVCDMDGTLLLDDGSVPEGFWPVLDDLAARGIAFVPASGRQLATLQRLFAQAPGELSYIAENGNLVLHGGAVISATTVPADFAREVVRIVRGAVADGANMGVVVCGRGGAFIERQDVPFVAECEKYYALLRLTDDLTQHCGDVLKLAVFDFDDAAAAAARYFSAVTGHQVVVSGAHWIDIMDGAANKGNGVRALQTALGIGPAQTAAFGDYLNDVEMLAASGHSFATANAHPDVLALAGRTIPANADLGVVTTLRALLDAADGSVRD